MNMKDLPTYRLTRLSARICCHCAHFKSIRCTKAPTHSKKEFRRFNWSSLSVCDDWRANSRTDEALQILTWRKLEGQDIEDFLDKPDTEPTVEDEK
jgi:hypothetical protein